MMYIVIANDKDYVGSFDNIPSAETLDSYLRIYTKKNKLTEYCIKEIQANNMNELKKYLIKNHYKFNY